MTKLPASIWNLELETSESRDSLIKFWLSAPFDQLEFLWASSFGTQTKSLVKALNIDFIFTDDQIAIRNSIGSRLSDLGLSHPLSCQLMIANFLLSPPGLLTINNIDSFFPQWLSASYSELYENITTTNFESNPNQPISQSIPATSISSNDNLDFGPFPLNLNDLISNRIHLNRLLGLSNLYYIDPDDSDICSELVSLRTDLAGAIDNSPESELQSYFSSEFGDRYWSLVRSGVQKEPLSPQDESIKHDVISRLNPDKQGGFGTPKAINAFLIAMMYFLPGTMKVSDAESKLPSWIWPYYKEIFLN